eukprot:c62_g1_i1.p1 GENE.c62_g1_i1~~c62_g1_i1.p1  ORF type:complete len:128 (-),score=32.16 c62_g1_i1:115-498(-)
MLVAHLPSLLLVIVEVVGASLSMKRYAMTTGNKVQMDAADQNLRLCAESAIRLRGDGLCDSCCSHQNDSDKNFNNSSSSNSSSGSGNAACVLGRLCHVYRARLFDVLCATLRESESGRALLDVIGPQ